ncbi:hypothetical protein F5Y06DRAFT_302906 [Hypoxylon sp. FL0890]|nr:hypothetical protein F5Y06DRAFT_302906 [Hypoxylon sp. FL0890]
MVKHTKYTHLSHNRQSGWEPDWQDGDIAFLKSADEFDQAEYAALIKSGYLHYRATKHPVIILEHSKDYQHFLVTTVSAYGSSEENDFLPPWKQSIHWRKSPADFRAFTGSMKSYENQRHLQLANGGRFPKIKASWVYTPNVFVVPSSVLKSFDKTKTRLRMDQTSLKGLLCDMEKHPRFATRWTNRKVLRMLGPEIPKIQEGPGSTETSASSTSSDDDSVTTSSLASDSKPNTPEPPTMTMSWAAVAKAFPQTPASAAILTSANIKSVLNRTLSCRQRRVPIPRPSSTTIQKCYG